MITGTYNLIAQPSWAAITFQEVRLECDTTLGPVVINLPAIAQLAQATNLKLFIVDATGNAGTNNITINGGFWQSGFTVYQDTFDDSTTTQLVLNTDGSSVLIQNVSATQWLATESVSSGSSGGLNIETITVDMNNSNLAINNVGLSEINYVFAGFNTFAEAKSSILTLSDGSYLVGPKIDIGGVPA